MAQKTSGELEKELMDGIERSTGKDLTTWLKILDVFESKKRNEVIAWLKAEHGFSHMRAALLGGIHANGGKPVCVPSGAITAVCPVLVAVSMVRRVSIARICAICKCCAGASESPNHATFEMLTSSVASGSCCRTSSPNEFS